MAETYLDTAYFREGVVHYGTREQVSTLIPIRTSEATLSIHSIVYTDTRGNGKVL